MSKENETYYLIDQYLKGELSEQESSQVAKKIAQDTSFAEQVQEQQLLNEVVDGAAIASLRQQMSKDIQSIDTQSGSSYKYYIIGAILLTTLSLTYVLWPSSGTKKNSEKAPTLAQETITQNTNREIEHSKKEKVSSLTPSLEVKKVVPVEKQTTGENEAPIQEVEKVIIDTITTQKAVVQQEPKNAASPTELEDICKKTTIDLDTKIIEGCSSSNDGEIIIENIKGGEAPYAVYDKNSSAIIKNNHYKGLKPGKYELYVIDANTCIHEVDYFVPAKNCKGTAYIINRATQQGWTPNAPDAHITIYNASGKIVYEKLPNTRLKEWMGVDQNGKPLGSGLYIYKIEKPNGHQVTGEINIMQ